MPSSATSSLRSLLLGSSRRPRPRSGTRESNSTPCGCSVSPVTSDNRNSRRTQESVNRYCRWRGVTSCSAITSGLQSRTVPSSAANRSRQKNWPNHTLKVTSTSRSRDMSGSVSTGLQALADDTKRKASRSCITHSPCMDRAQSVLVDTDQPILLDNVVSVALEKRIPRGRSLHLHIQRVHSEIIVVRAMALNRWAAVLCNPKSSHTSAAQNSHGSRCKRVRCDLSPLPMRALR